MIEGLARLIPARRSAEDIFAGHVRLVLGGEEFVVPVRSRKANREWLVALDGRLAALLDSLEVLDDEAEVLALLFGATDAFLDALLSYDAEGVLPPRETIDERATDIEIMTAVMEVWRAAHPLAAIALGLAPSVPSTPSPASTPSPPAPTAGLP